METDTATIQQAVFYAADTQNEGSATALSLISYMTPGLPNSALISFHLRSKSRHRVSPHRHHPELVWNWFVALVSRQSSDWPVWRRFARRRCWKRFRHDDGFACLSQFTLILRGLPVLRGLFFLLLRDWFTGLPQLRLLFPPDSGGTSSESVFSTSSWFPRAVKISRAQARS